MFTRQYYYYVAMKNFGVQSFKTRWVPTENEMLAADLKNLSGVALPATYWEPFVEYNSYLYWDYLYSFSLAGNNSGSVTTPGVSFHGSNNPKNQGVIIVIGSGDDEPTLGDYALETQITSGISKQVTHSNIFYDSVNDKWYVDETAIFTRTSNESITVKEWGLYGSTHETGTSGAHRCLYRALLVSPITLNTGDSIKIVVRFSMDAHKNS